MWDWVHPQQVCRWHQAVWCGWHAGGKGRHSEGPGQAAEVGLREPHEIQQGQAQGPARGSGQFQTQARAGRRAAWEQPWGLFVRVWASVAATFGFLAAFLWIWCSPGIVFPSPMWMLLAALTGKPVFICVSFGCKRRWESGCWLPPSPGSCSALLPAMGPSAPSEHAWAAMGTAGTVSTRGLNFLAVVLALLLGL